MEMEIYKYTLLFETHNLDQCYEDTFGWYDSESKAEKIKDYYMMMCKSLCEHPRELCEIERNNIIDFLKSEGIHFKIYESIDITICKIHKKSEEE
jgi:hypothetical protein